MISTDTRSDRKVLETHRLLPVSRVQMYIIKREVAIIKSAFLLLYTWLLANILRKLLEKVQVYVHLPL